MTKHAILLTTLLFIVQIKSTAQQYKLPVDATADLYNYISDNFEEDGIDKMAVFNTNSNELLIYNLLDRSIEKKVKYDNQGPNALLVRTLLSGMKYINKDSIFYFDVQLQQGVLSDDRGNIYKRFSTDAGFYGIGSLGMTKSMAYRKEHMYMISWPVTVVAKTQKDIEDLPIVVAKLSLADGSVEKLDLDVPESKSRADISQDLQDFTIIYNSITDRFVINFPVSKFLIETDFNGFMKKHQVESDLVQDFALMDKYKNQVGPSMLISYCSWLSDKYSKLFYDKSTGFYFRVARKGISEADFSNQEFNSRVEVLVLDEDFNLIKKLSHHGGSLLYLFVMGSYVYWNSDFIKYNVEAGNEDELFFDKYSLK
jgi:hypothetical protein